jgi:hypothetical protein
MACHISCIPFCKKKDDDQSENNGHSAPEGHIRCYKEFYVLSRAFKGKTALRKILVRAFIIGFSGYALAFPMQVSYIIPEFTTGWIWQLFGIMHSDEALLAIVFILFWHFYNEHLKPESFPMSWIWITGKISTERLKHHHPIEYDLLFGQDTSKKKKKE